MSRPVRAVLAHGAGSSPEFVRATFANPGVSVSSWWLSGHGGRPPAGPEHDLAALGRLVRALRPDTVGGVSYGAHLAARWACSDPGEGAGWRPRALLLVMPAWTGERGGAVADATAAAAREIGALGLEQATARAADRSPDWVGLALRSSWPSHQAAGLVAALLAVAASPAPSLRDLGRIALPATVVALAGDPLHPAEVAAEWAAAIPRARLVTVASLEPTAVLGAGLWTTRP